MGLEYIQFGCGLCGPPGWSNFDAIPTLWLQKYQPFKTPLLVRRGYGTFGFRGIYLTPPNATGCGLTRVANGAGSVCTAC